MADTQTRVARLVTLVITGVVLALVLRELSILWRPVVLAVTGVSGMGLFVWLGGHRLRTRSAVGAGLLAPVAGAGFLGGLLLTMLLVVDQTFPVEEEALLSVGGLTVVSYSVVTLGCFLALLGVGFTVWPAGECVLQRAESVVLGAIVVPVVTVLLFGAGSRVGVNPDETVAAPLAGTTGSLLAPTGPELHLWSLLVLSALGAAGITAALRPAMVPTRRDSAAVSGIVAVAVLVYAFERTTDPFEVQRTLGATHDAIQVVTTTPLLRVALLACAVPLVGGAVVAVRDAQNVRSGAIVGGALSTLVLLSVAERLYARALSETVRLVPAEIEDDVSGDVTAAASIAGESTLVLGALVLCLAISLSLLLSVRSLHHLGLVRPGETGPVMGALGLFVVAAFVGVLDGPAWLVFGGIAGSVLVWDTGQFGAMLRRECGNGRVERVEWVHLAGSVAVAGVGIALSLALVTQFPSASGIISSTTLLALVSVVVGVLSLAVALR